MDRLERVRRLPAFGRWRTTKSKLKSTQSRYVFAKSSYTSSSTFEFSAQDMHVLNLGTRTSNWWLANGPGCMPTYNFSAIDPISFKPQIVRVEQCLLDYQYVEVAHSSIQILLSIFALISGGFLAVFYRGKDATCFEDRKSNPLPNYSLTLKPSSTDHSTPDELYGISTKPTTLSNFRNSTYETTSRSIKPNDLPYTSTIPNQSNSYTNGVLPSNPLRNNPLPAGSTRRTSVRPSSIYNNSSNASNDPIYRVMRNGHAVNGLLNGVDNVRAYKHLQAPPAKDGGVGSKVSSLLNAGMHSGVNMDSNTSQAVEAAYGHSGTRQPSPAPRAPVYMPGSVSPYHSRAGTEVSF
ncbi:hypothetical protein RvY_13321 [Ramazzottius varieornatus]|uniref:Sodium/potassium-transporting ATPase subunit beta-1-interacting protein n=1 Tax=Ramazzottius varieornatus TaxID=947166 RepID=A0A1D1VW12_RAMVA|nr:hypothetical protein RvY_13321 [Ramazzottius varieornatus]